MKTLKISTVLFLLILFTGALITGCSKDDDEINPESIPKPTDIALGVRLSIDSIVCLNAHDVLYEIGSNYDSDIELFGYIRAWSSFDYPVGNEKKNFEKTDTSMLWFRDYDDFALLPKDKVLKIEKYTDFFFDNEKSHLSSIHLDFFFLDQDILDPIWSSNPIHHIMYSELIDDKVERVEHISYTMEEIDYYDRVFQKTHTLYLRSDLGTSQDLQIMVHYSFHPITVKSVATLPDGYSMGDEIIEPDLFPEIPTISAYAAQPPAKSEELVVGQKVLSKFSPEPMMARIGGVNYPVYGINPKFVTGSQLDEFPEFIPVDRPQWGGEEPWNGLLTFGPIPQKVPDILSGPGLQSKPRLQMIRYWVPINVERVPAGVTLTTSTQITHGIGSEFKYEFSITTGFEVGAGIFSFNLEITHTFGYTFSYNYSVSKTKTIEIAAPDDKNVTFVTWQLVEEFRVVDENGELFTDPNYDFKSMLIATIPTDHIVEEAHQFSAH